MTSTQSGPPVATGDPAPGFTLPDADGNPVSLSDFAGRPVIVYFYPAAMTPGCTTQACDFTSARGSFDGGGYTVLGIPPTSRTNWPGSARRKTSRSSCSRTPTVR